MCLVCQILDEEEIAYEVRPARDAAREYLDSCKGQAKYTRVKDVVAALKDHPRNTKAVLGWNGAMACRFLRLAGVWEEIGQTEKNMILGYEVAK